MSTGADPHGDQLLELFQRRCIRLASDCTERANIVHEINGRRRKPWNVPSNRVAVCVACHAYIHRCHGNSWEVREETRAARDRLMKQLEITWEEIEACYNLPST